LRRAAVSVLAALFALLLFASSARAWNASGHLQIALIAYKRLTPAARERAVELIRHHPRFAQDFEAQKPVELHGPEQERQWIFAHASTWPDIARKQPSFNRETWHYINEPIYLNEEALAFFERHGLPNNVSHELAGGASEKELNVVQAILLAKERLSKARSSRAERALSLSWLMHLVGDVHQPLHTAGFYSKRRFPRGDKGGNDVLVGKRRSLHSTWDGFLGTSESLPYLHTKIAEYLRDPELARAADAAATSLSVDTWVDESYRLAYEFAYDGAIVAAVDQLESSGSRAKPSANLPASYVSRGKEHAKRRAVQSGYRLAALIERLVP
jgi:hypothetical protein